MGEPLAALSVKDCPTAYGDVLPGPSIELPVNAVWPKIITGGEYLGRWGQNGAGVLGGVELMVTIATLIQNINKVARYSRSTPSTC